MNRRDRRSGRKTTGQRTTRTRLPIRGAVLAIACGLLIACAGEDKGNNAGADSGTGTADAAHASLEARVWEMVAEGALLLDVRTPEEYAAGHLEGAVNIPFDQLRRRVGELGEDRDRPVITYCRTGRRSGISERDLRRAGFANVVNGGWYTRLKAARPEPAGH